MTKPRRLHAAAAALGAMLFSIAAVAPVQAAAPAGCAGPASNFWLIVNAEGVRATKGRFAITVYPDDSRRFLAKKGSLFVARLDATGGTTRACVHLPGPGVYALALYHDENGNGKFDRTGIGLPAEGYGFSNNPSTVAGLPAFRAVRLNVPKAGLVTRVQMKYP
jgi:uncharacterized protein (DUF2141 family)